MSLSNENITVNTDFPSTMSIIPRIIVVPNGLEAGEFRIRNHNRDDSVLLFKIHRSEPKLVSYNPKKGIIEPGHESSVCIKLIDPKITLARVLVKVVEISRSRLGASFNLSWNLGLKTIVKKVVEIRNATYCLTSEFKGDSLSFVSDSFASLSERGMTGSAASTPRSLGSLSISPRQSYISHSFIPKISSPIERDNAKRKLDVNESIEQSNDGRNNSNNNIHGSLVTDNESSGFQKSNSFVTEQQSFLETVLQNIKRGTTSLDEAKALLLGLGLGMPLLPADSDFNAQLANMSVSHSIDNKTNTSSDIKTKQIIDSNNIKQQNVDLNATKCSCLSLISPNHQSALLLTLRGHYVDNFIASKAIQLRLDESINSDQRIAAIEISNAQSLTDIHEMVNNLFTVVNTNSEDKKVTNFRAALLRDNLRHLTITSTSIERVGPYLNNFDQLTHLDLSSNNISAITGSLEFRQLTYLNLSHNNLTSLDYIQNLISLKTLLVSSNELYSLNTSISVLIPLAGSLQVLDMSFNPVCNNLQYSDQILTVLPNLKYFDGENLDALRQRVNTHQNNRRDISDFKSSPISKQKKPISEFTRSHMNKDKTDEFLTRLKRALKRQKSNVLPKQDPHETFEEPPSMISSGKLKAPDADMSYNKTNSRYDNFNDESSVRSVHSSSIARPRYVASPSRSLLELTDSVAIRRRCNGMPTSNAHVENKEVSQSYSEYSSARVSDRGYYSDDDPLRVVHTRRSRSKSVSSAVARMTPEKLQEMQEDEKYGIFNPRYRIPSSIFGHSKPFIERAPTKPNADVPLFEKTINRLRDGFEKSPTRGTFPRAPKGLKEEWYSMDIEDARALKRRGYFDSNIGDTSRHSFKDKSHYKRDNESSVSYIQEVSGQFSEGNVSISSNGSTIIHQRHGRRPLRSGHISRLYLSEESQYDDPRYSQPEDQFSGYRKWHPELYLTQPKQHSPSRITKSIQSDTLSTVEPNPQSNHNESASFTVSHDSISDKLYQSQTLNDLPDTIDNFSNPNNGQQEPDYKSADSMPWVSFDKKPKNLVELLPSEQRNIGENIDDLSPINEVSTSLRNELPNEDKNMNQSSRSLIGSVMPPKNTSSPKRKTPVSIPLKDELSSYGKPTEILNEDNEQNSQKNDKQVDRSDFISTLVKPHVQESKIKDNELSEYLNWLEEQHVPQSIKSTTEYKSSVTDTLTKDILSAKEHGSSALNTPSKIARLVRSPNTLKSPPEKSSESSHSNHQSKLSTGIPLSVRSKSPGEFIKASPRPYSLPGEGVDLISRFTSHDLEYTPLHPREAAMKAEKIDAFSYAPNPLRNLMSTP